MSVEDIMALNNLATNEIKVGQVLKLSGAKRKVQPLTVSDLCITGSAIPLHVADGLYLYHLLPIKKVEEKLGVRVYASQKSGYRPKEYEIQKGRSGDSEHTFEERHLYGVGATDWTSDKIQTAKTPEEKRIALEELRDALISETDYRRIAVYWESGFIHCDYASDTQRILFNGVVGKDWEWEGVVK